MVLQSIGKISLVDIAGEFGGTAPHKMSEYFGVAVGVPGSGNRITIATFYGKSNNPDPPSWNGQNLNLGYKAINSSVSIGLAATSDSPVTFSIVSAPGGIGTISGSTFSVTVPSTTGSRSWTIRATDAEDQSTDATLTIHAVKYGYSRGYIYSYSYIGTGYGGNYYINGVFLSSNDVVRYENGANRYGVVSGSPTTYTERLWRPEQQFEAGERWANRSRYLGYVDANFDRWSDGYIDDLPYATTTTTYWTQGYIYGYTYSTTVTQPEQTINGTFYSNADVYIYQNGAYRYGYVDSGSYGIVQY